MPHKILTSNKKRTKGDKYENDVAEYISSCGLIHNINIQAERPVASTLYSDVKITYNSLKSWLEVKLNHSDRLSNPQMFYTDGKWHCALTSKSPTAKSIACLLNKSEIADNWVTLLSKFSGIKKDKLILSSNKPPKNEPNYITKDIIKAFIKKYMTTNTIMMIKNIDITTIVEDHYTQGKAEPANYIQIKDDFFLLGKSNPLKFNSNIPIFKATGYIDVRFVPRESANMCNFQTIIKSTDKNISSFSFAPHTKKLLPII